MQNRTLKLIGNEFFVEWLSNKLPLIKNGQGAILFIDGEVGFGKTHLLNFASEYIKQNFRNVRAVYTETQSPVGSVKIGTIQPLQPFLRAIEGIAKSDTLDPKVKLIKNIALTTLSAIPFLGDIPYILKELPRDFENYKKEVERNNPNNQNTFVQYYYELLLKNIEKKEVVLLFDDMHWCDSQSVELIKQLIKNIHKIPLILVFTYRKTLVETQGLPFIAILKTNYEEKNVDFVSLKAFELKNISELCQHYFKNYKQNSEFEEWIYEKTGGTPSIVCEYLNYFSLYPPFDEKGNAVTNFKDNEFLPDSIHNLFTQYIEILTEEEKNILTICSAEGLEFTVFIISKLLDCDLLTTIKKLRAIQNKTGFIKSLGAMNKYGIKTTVYKFTQVFYHNFFESLLEYEEKVELHTRIADLLKEQYKTAENNLIKSEIAPFIAAHSFEAGDSNTAENMLIESASLGKDYLSDEIIDAIISSFKNLNPANTDIIDKLEKIKSLEDFTEMPKSNGSIDTDLADVLIDFKSVSKSVVNDILNNEYDLAKNKINKFLEIKSNQIELSERIYLYSMLAKIYIDTNNFNNAKEILDNTDTLLEKVNDNNILAVYNNVCALYYYYNKNLEKSKNFIEKNINIYNFLNDETKLFILSVISLIIKDYQPEEFNKFKELAIKLSSQLNFDILKTELNKL